jgi:hypothetical protein
VADRHDAWRNLLGRAKSRTTGADGSLRVEFGESVELVELARLVEAEQRCCAFFSFGITLDAYGLALEVHVPSGATDVARALFAQAE